MRRDFFVLVIEMYQNIDTGKKGGGGAVRNGSRKNGTKVMHGMLARERGWRVQTYKYDNYQFVVNTVSTSSSSYTIKFTL